MKRLLACLAASLLLSAGSAFADALLRPGDSFDLRIGGVPSEDIGEISSNYTIDGEGFVNLPLLGKMHVGGKTASEIQSMVENTYRDKGLFTHPTITLTIAAGARFVNLGGQVKSPGRIPYTPDMTVLTAINAAGDFTDYADQGKVRLIRNGEVKIINCKKIRSDPSQDPLVLPGDIIQVPEGWF